MMSRPFSFPSAVPVLAGELVQLRGLVEADVPAWFLRASDAESAVLAGDSIPESIEMGTAWLQGHRTRFAQRTSIRWAIVPRGTNASVGTIGLTITATAPATAELGYVIGRAAWNRGLCTDAARTVVDYAFNTLGLAEIRADPLQRNLASRRVLEKCGFSLLRAIPADRHSDPDAEDSVLYGLQNRAAA